MNYINFLGLPDEFRDLERAAAAILPVPYDATSTWKKGADRGPAAILEASNQVELYDIETASEPYRQGIATLDPVRVEGPPDELADAVERASAAILQRQQIPVVLGGEHSVSIGAIRAAAAVFSDLSVLQIDAHGDTRESYEGSPFNHACVMARARELGPVVQVGIRAVDASEIAALDPERVFWGHELHGDDGWIERVVSLLTPDVYVTIDLDAFDPSLMPATGTPEPGGMSWQQVMELLDAVTAAHRVVGFDVVELLPQPGDHACDFLAAKLVYRFLAMIFAAR
ncbi:MAG: agmatinase [Acidobacteriota bacterium]|jgi:agmatinase